MKEDNNIPEKGIEEGNRLIAEFMGAVIRGSSVSKDYEYAVYRDNEGFEMLTVRMDNLEYHSSWDWLMPVVEKIRLLEETGDFEETKEAVRLYANIKTYLLALNLLQLWQAVVQFIQWYNSQQKIKS